MELFRTHSSYSTVDKEDPDERRHRQAQFLIYKVMEQADYCRRRRPPTSSVPRRIMSKLKIRIRTRLRRARELVARSTICIAKRATCLCAPMKAVERVMAGWKQAICAAGRKDLVVLAP